MKKKYLVPFSILFLCVVNHPALCLSNFFPKVENNEEKVTTFNILLQLGEKKCKPYDLTDRLGGKEAWRSTKGDSWAPYNRIIFGMLDTLCQIIGNHSLLLILQLSIFQSKNILRNNFRTYVNGISMEFCQKFLKKIIF